MIDPSDGSTLQAFQIDLGAVADETDLAAQIDAALGALRQRRDRRRRQSRDHARRLPARAWRSPRATPRSRSPTPPAATRDYGFAHYFGLNDLMVSDGPRASDLAVRSDIAGDAALLATARLDVADRPPLAATLGGAGDNRGAQALADALERQPSR